MLLYLAWSGRPTFFLVLLACSLLSDCTDGFIARKLNQMSEFGTKLDSWADLATYMSLPLCAWWLWPELVHREFPFIITVIVSYIFPVAFGLGKYRSLPGYHTWSAKIASVLIGFSVLVLFVGGPSLPFRISVPIIVLAGIEQIAITVILPQARTNVPSFWHAKKLLREDRCQTSQ